jgi:malate/lactate dehydrogenase
MIACSIFVEGEYEQMTYCMWSRVLVNGVEEIVEIELKEKEKSLKKVQLGK